MNANLLIWSFSFLAMIHINSLILEMVHYKDIIYALIKKLINQN